MHVSTELMHKQSTAIIKVTMTILLQFSSRELRSRTKDMFEAHCSMLHLDHAHVSKTYEVARKPAINRLQYFYTTDGLPPDVMHDLLEGAVKMEIKALLNMFVNEKSYFRVDQFNRRLQAFK